MGERRSVYTGYWWENLAEREHLERPGRRWEDNINMNQEEAWEA